MSVNVNQEKTAVLEKENQKLKDEIKELEFSYEELDHNYAVLLKEYDKQEAELASCMAVKNSFFWKMTKPLRVIVDFAKAVKRLIFTESRLIFKGVKSLVKYGPKRTMSKIRYKMYLINDYAEFMKYHKLKPFEISYQKNKKFTKNILFSVVVPLYNTPENFLRDMIESVLNQTYSNHELCLADASDKTNDTVFRVCKEYANKFDFIKYKRLDKNGGIPANTNAALEMASGDYIVLLDHDDMLSLDALFECASVIEEQGADFIYSDEMTFKDRVDNVKLIHFKPDFSPDTLRSHNYICHLCAFSRELQKKVGFFRDEYNGSQDYDIILRLCEQAKKIVHIKKVLYYWREHQNSVASDVSVKPYCMDSAKKALAAHLKRVGLKGKVYDSDVLSTYRIEYEIEGNPKVSVIILNKDHISDLRKCLYSIENKTTYNNYEVVIVENNSESEETFEYYKLLEKKPNIKVVRYKGKGFNYPVLNEVGVENSNGEYLLFLNNDMEVITHDWIEQMLMFVQRKDVGAAGAMLYYPDDTIQHAGLILGLGGAAAHAHRHFLRGNGGYMHRTAVAQNLSGVTGACLMTKRSVWEEVGGMNKDLEIAFNDVDYCLKLRKKGYLIVFTPYAELYHYESKSRGYEDTDEKKARYENEYRLLKALWKKEIDEGDPYYNPNLTLDREDFSLK